MKKILFLAFILVATLGVQAQVVTGLRTEEGGKMGEYTEWKKSTVIFDDNSTAEIEYRIALIKRKGIACHYDVEVKNNSDIKITVRIKSSYYDKLVKGNYGEEAKETLKAGKSVVAHTIAQGCKKEKDVEKDDYEHCMACEFGVSIYVSK